MGLVVPLKIYSAKGSFLQSSMYTLLEFEIAKICVKLKYSKKICINISNFTCLCTLRRENTQYTFHNLRAKYL